MCSLLAGIEELGGLLQGAKDQEDKDVPGWMKTLKLKIMNLDPSDPFVLEHKVAKILKSWDSKINNAAPVHKQAICDWLLSNNLVDRIFICHRELKAIRTVASEATAEVATRALRWTAPDALDFLKSLGSVLHIEDPVLLIAEVTTQDLAASDAKFFLSHGQQSIRIEASSFTPAIQELATAIGSLSPCSVSFQLRNSTASVADVAKPVHNQPHTLDGSEAVPAGPINKVRLTEQHAGSADMLYHVKYEGLGDYPAQMQYQVKVIRDRSFPTTIPVHFALDLDQPFKRSQVLRVEWSGKMKDSVFVTWRSDFLRNINRPVRVEETITRTLEGTLGGGFPASLNLGFSRAGSRTVTTQYDPLPFDTTYISNGVSSKGLSIKPSTKHPDIDWPNLDFGTNVSQIVIRSPRGLITHCQAVYGLIPFKAAELTRIEIGTEYVIVAEVDIPSIDDDRKDIELEHGSDYLANARKDEVDRSKGEREERHGKKKAEQQAEGHGERQAEGWLLRTIRRLRGLPHDRRAEQEIGRTVARSGQTASTNSVASQPIVRKCWYNLFAKGESLCVCGEKSQRAEMSLIRRKQIH